MTQDCLHPLPAGTPVIVVITSARNRPFVEGRAYVVSPFGDEPHVYLVQFEGEALPQIRIVLPEWQHDPAQALNHLNAPRHTTPDAPLPRALQLALLSPGGNKLAGRKRGER